MPTQHRVEHFEPTYRSVGHRRLAYQEVARLALMKAVPDRAAPSVSCLRWDRERRSKESKGIKLKSRGYAWNSHTLLNTVPVDRRSGPTLLCLAREWQSHRTDNFVRLAVRKTAHHPPPTGCWSPNLNFGLTPALSRSITVSQNRPSRAFPLARSGHKVTHAHAPPTDALCGPPPLAARRALGAGCLHTSRPLHLQRVPRCQ